MLARRDVVGQVEMVDTTKARAGFTGEQHSPGYDGSKRMVNITIPATEMAKQWAGWGTALKPALEPITMARKPLGGTVAENVTRWGTGAVNVDGCRVGTDVVGWAGAGAGVWNEDTCGLRKAGDARPVEGRWPANFIHDGHREVCKLLGESYRFFYTAKAGTEDRNAGCEGMPVVSRQGVRPGSPDETGKFPDHDHRERTSNHHPTVKPTDLMRYLVRLVTPPGGVVLDPFMGSGSTGRGAMLEGMRFVGIEREAEYVEIARCRIGTIEKPTEREGGVPRAATLFAV